MGEGALIVPEGSLYPPGCWGVKRFECELVWWRRPQAGTQNPENLLPLPCCVSWSKLLTLSGLVSQWRQRDRRLASISLFFLREGQPILGGRGLSQKDTCSFDLNAGPEECTSEPWALQTPQAEQGAHPAQRPVSCAVAPADPEGEDEGRTSQSRGFESLSPTPSQARSLLRERGWELALGPCHLLVTFAINRHIVSKL